jgi:hypothetical protein
MTPRLMGSDKVSMATLDAEPASGPEREPGAIAQILAEVETR